jgi:CRP/FNR family cyclic AMP-dependent transcriptional regulator
MNPQLRSGPPCLSSFHTCLKETLLRASVSEFPKNSNVYNAGDRDELVFYVECGLVKTLAVSHSGKECLLEIHGGGECFGELCLAGSERLETATVMKPAVLRKLQRETLLRSLRTAGVLEDLVRHLAAKLARQQQIITDFVTVDSEKRLAATLLRLARNLGKSDSRGVRIDERISFEELSEMVGTTRSRVGYFLKMFRSLDLIQITSHKSLIVNESRLVEYLRGEVGKVQRKPPEQIGRKFPVRSCATAP